MKLKVTTELVDKTYHVTLDTVPGSGASSAFDSLEQLALARQGDLSISFGGDFDTTIDATPVSFTLAENDQDFPSILPIRQTFAAGADPATANLQARAWAEVVRARIATAMEAAIETTVGTVGTTQHTYAYDQDAGTYGEV